MEEFLNDYVQMIAEVRGMTLTPDQLQLIVNNLREDDEIWDLLDSKINYELDLEAI